jgi:hypothetical protein
MDGFLGGGVWEWNRLGRRRHWGHRGAMEMAGVPGDSVLCQSEVSAFCYAKILCERQCEYSNRQFFTVSWLFYRINSFAPLFGRRTQFINFFLTKPHYFHNIRHLQSRQFSEAGMELVCFMFKYFYGGCL